MKTCLMILDGCRESRVAMQEMQSMMLDINSKWVFDPTQEALGQIPYPWGHAITEKQEQITNDN